MKKQYWFAWLLSAAGFAFASSHPSEKPLPAFFTQPDATAKVLGWRAVPVTRQNACGGYYWEPPSLRASAAQARGKPVITHIASQGPAVLRSNGVSVLSDHVLVTQPGRMVWADRATLYRNPHGRIIKIIAVGHVHVFEQGQLSVTPRMVLKIREDTLHATQVVYRVRGLQAKVQQAAFGRAFSVKRDAQHVWFLRHATYSTCAPTHPAWLVHAKRLRLDSKAQKGKAHQLWLSVKGVPIFYAPYWSFPLGSHTRKTGFLAPSWVHDSRSGTGLRLPFYWNMAPNHDMLLTTTYETRRHWLLEERFRWLTRHTQGNFSFNWLPKDAAFAAFKQNSLNHVRADPAMQPYATALQGMGTSRYFTQGTWSWLWGRHGSAFLQLARVSDPYYLRDVGWTYGSTSSDELLSQLQLHYRTMHWQSDWAALDFQTLHTPDQPTLQDAYGMLAWDLAGFYAGPAHLNWQWQSQVARFQLSSSGREGRPDGNRMHLRPGVAWVHQHASWYWTPQLQWDATAYQLQHGAGAASSEGKARALPIFDVDAGWYGMRHMQWRDHDVWASIHPRVRYLYVPYQNQSGLPDFDAQALPFTAAQIFANNRYVGYDRIMNANQLSLGFDTQWMNASGAAFLQLDSGVIRYFTPPKVALDGVVPDAGAFSPWATTLSWYPTQHSSAYVNVSWDFSAHHDSSLGAGWEYKSASNKVLDLAYLYTPDDYSRYQRVVIGGAWPVGVHWHALAYTSRLLSSHRSNSLYAGMEYNGCCLALRFLVNRVYIGDRVSTALGEVQPQYKHQFVLQLLFKGLGSVANSNFSSVIAATLPSYHDQFK